MCVRKIARMNIVIALLFTVTVYTPGMCGPINGGDTNAAGRTPRIGTAACGFNYKLGQRFEIVDPETVELLAQYDMPTVFVCEDRGGMVGHRNLDLVFYTKDTCNDAAQFGRRKNVEVVLLDRVEFSGRSVKVPPLADR